MQTENKIVILGCGWLGKKLIDTFANTKVIAVSQTTEVDFPYYKTHHITPFVLDFHLPQKLPTSMLETEGIIISIPSSRKRTVENLDMIFKNLVASLTNYQGNIIFFSSIGIYPNVQKNIDEDTFLEKDLDKHLYLGERYIQEAFPKAAILRLGGLMGADRMFSNYFTDKDIPNPKHAVNHIHYRDIAKVVELFLQKNKSGIYNVVAPVHPTKQQVYDYQTQQLLYDVEESVGKRVSPKKLIDALDYTFLHPNPIYFT